MKRSDRELFDAWRGGDERAGNELLDRHFTALYRFFRNKVGESAEDLVQQTFLACVRARDGFRQDSSFRTYLFTAARSKLHDYFARKVKRRAEVAWGERSIEDMGLSPSVVVAQRQEQRLLQQALRRLPLDLHVTIELYYLHGMRAREIATVTEVPVGTVRSRIRRGVAALREAMEELKASPRLIHTTLTELGTDRRPLPDGDER